MQDLQEYIATIEKDEHRIKFTELIKNIQEQFFQLQLVFKWNQPMFICKGTFIISFNKSQKHISVSPEVAAIKKFSEEITASGYQQTKGTFRIRWQDTISYPLLFRIVSFNLNEKKNYSTFWRKTSG